MSTKALDIFGALLMKRVRDQVILEMEKCIDGSMGGAAGRQVRNILRPLDQEQRDAVRRLVPVIVDKTLHHVLWTFQQEEEITITVKTKETTEDLREASLDGLEGEIFDWIDKYSQYSGTD